MLALVGVGTAIINFSGPASPQRHDPSSPPGHTLSCTPKSEEPDWVRSRETFGRALSTRQVVRHKIVDVATAVDAARTYTRCAIDGVVAGDTDVQRVSMAKNLACEACDLAVDTAVQLYGGMGYLRESEVERHYRDARILSIGGGTTEIMKEIIAKTMGL